MMKSVIGYFAIALASSAIAPGALAANAMQADLGFPAGAEQLETRLLAAIGPNTRAWISNTGATAGRSDTVSEASVRNDVVALGSMADADINALAFLVLMQAARSAKENLKAIMDGVKSINAQKKKLRDQLQDRQAGMAEEQALEKRSAEKAVELQNATNRQQKVHSALDGAYKKAASGTAAIVSPLD